MGSLVYAAAVFAIILLVYWVIKNEKVVSNGEKSTGIFAMKDDKRKSGNKTSN